MKKLVYGVGYNSKKTPCKVNGKMTRTYTTWTNMLRRCYSDNYLIKRPTYNGCYVSEEFKDFSFFDDWCKKQIGFNLGWDLDKDILINENKVYSKDTCIFIPKEINTIIRNKWSRDGKYPYGITFDSQCKKIRARITINGIQYFLGHFDNIDDAIKAYKQKKEEVIVDIANKYKGIICDNSYSALININI